ncbi:3'-5' exonuclease [Lentibacillus salinarum]|uniref:PolC-type DNA polymerase III n=1 Tax=Lentibacillus salinarum TaxID=446820 RepID=A0ABW3ZXK9_9BACI
MFKDFQLLFIDFETTGLSPEQDYPTEVAVLKTDGFNPKGFSSKIQLPDGVEIPDDITELTGLTANNVNAQGISREKIKSVLKTFVNEETLVIAHNANFDLGFLYHHFGIIPKHFMCTRTIEYLTNPHLSLSLKHVYPRYVADRQQTHRAGDDVSMTKAVFDAQVSVHGQHAMEFFLNKMVRTPERNLVYCPSNAIVLDFRK